MGFYLWKTIYSRSRSAFYSLKVEDCWDCGALLNKIASADEASHVSHLFQLAPWRLLFEDRIYTNHTCKHTFAMWRAHLSIQIRGTDGWRLPSFPKLKQQRQKLTMDTCTIQMRYIRMYLPVLSVVVVVFFLAIIRVGGRHLNNSATVSWRLRRTGGVARRRPGRRVGRERRGGSWSWCVNGITVVVVVIIAIVVFVLVASSMGAVVVARMCGNPQMIAVGHIERLCAAVGGIGN